MPVKFNVRTKIIVNGKEYSSPDEMPPDVRLKYEQALAKRGTSPNVQVKSSSKIKFNGQTFNSADEMPADIRRIYDSVMASVDKNQDGLPDTLQSGNNAQATLSNPVLSPNDGVIAPSKVDGRLVIAVLAVILAILLLGALILILISHGI